ncbi:MULTISPECIES: cupin domain-containing protein [unclassified Paenibacillus]|uniref:cupin domain-containing protein n=1 Tax=unclassified Paenibacillus TaxID=185978 RepID=UPI001AEA26A0|nr:MULTISPECIES: cupin domain-containing protein [unclassified Paenibacillus]MBP1154073.1 gentisate 1,2-dioxygenase [Paenibacillus sp. PvP091]MBP1170542.1 gentisate 1,2-dioxygenase [Paenibacillus sp. PvR098]MBP2441570.1 gentisate 1,2-dioxygenase [Paenibacillus sp. PvP052]
MADKLEFFQSQTVKDFNKEIEKYHLGPLWNAIPDLMHKQPTPQAVPYLWKWETLYAKLMEASEIFTPDRGGERRAIYLQNPGLTSRQPWGWASTTQTLYAAVQLILPGETAPSHRHTQSALRFIMKGEGAYTIVQGERIFMDEGDFLTTPGGLWHGHSHPGNQPMIWMDCLDIPTIHAIGGSFFESYPEKIEQPKVPDNYTAQRYEGGMVRPISDRHPKVAPLGSYKWSQTLAALEGLSRFEPDPYDGYAVEFINPSNGKTANPNIASWMQKLPGGFHSKAHRHTSSTIYQVFKGKGYSVINGTRYDWSQGDFLVIPNWAWHEHFAAEDSYLFSASDLPIMEKFELQREENYEENQGNQEIIDEFKPLLP